MQNTELLAANRHQHYYLYPLSSHPYALQQYYQPQSFSQQPLMSYGNQHKPFQQETILDSSKIGQYKIVFHWNHLDWNFPD